MREIKFRARVKGNWVGKKEGEWEYFTLHDFVDSRLFGDSIDCLTLNHIDFETLGEWTGLLDKNGKEIYEGDIVRLGETIYKVGIGGYFSKNSCGWGVHYISSNPDEFAIEASPMGSEKYIEVIGSIYENPELLEAK